MTRSIASDNLLLGNRLTDEIHVRQMSDEAFVISFDIPLWQRRMKAIGQVGIECIASSEYIFSFCVCCTQPGAYDRQDVVHYLLFHGPVIAFREIKKRQEYMPRRD